MAFTTISFQSMARPIPLRVRSMVGLIPLFAVRVLEERRDRAAAGFRQADGMVYRASQGSGAAHLVTCNSPEQRQRRQPAIICWRFHRKIGSSACCATCWMRTNSSRRYGVRSLSRYHKDHPCRLARSTGRNITCDYAPGRIGHAAVRRQFQLARAGLVSAELSADRSAGALSPFLWRQVQGGMSGRFGDDG